MTIARYILPLLLACIAGPTADAQTSNPQQAAEELRAAATGYALTTMATVQQSLDVRCGRMPGEAGPRAQAAYRTWLDRNTPALEGAIRHLHTLSQTVAEAQGADAGRQFGEARIAEATTVALQSIATMFPVGTADDPTCARILHLATGGEMDLLRHPEFGVVLEQLGRAAD